MSKRFQDIDSGGAVQPNVDTIVGVRNGNDVLIAVGTATEKNCSNPALAAMASVSGTFIIGHVAVFSDTAGSVIDGGALAAVAFTGSYFDLANTPTIPSGTAANKAASNNSKPNLASVNGPITSGHVAIFSDTSGTVADGGALAAVAFSGVYADLSGTPTIPSGSAANKGASDNSQSAVSSVKGIIVAGHVAVFQDTAGTIGDGGELSAVAFSGAYSDLSGAPSVLTLSGVNAFTGQQYAVANALTPGSSVAWNLNLSQAATLAPAQNFTLANPTNMKAGATYTLTITQDATGSRIITYGNAYKFPGGTPFVLSTAPAALDLLTFYCDGGKMLCVGSAAFA